MQKSLRFKSKRANRGTFSHGRGSRVWWLLTVFVLLIFISGLVVGNMELAKRREALEQNLGALKKQLKGIQGPLKTQQENDLSNNLPAYLERIAREDLNFMRAGEKVVAFPEKIEEEVDKTEGLLQKIKDKPK